jgi:CHC2 zinc finger
MLATYLDMLHGAEPAGGYTELRHKLPSGGMKQLFFDQSYLSTRERIMAVIRTLGGETDVYVGVCARRARHGGRDAVAHAHVLWADCDTRAATAALRRFEPQPSFVVRSGSPDCLHGYWALWPPVTPDVAERANRRLVHALGSDPAVCDAARIMRPPESFNHKHDPSTPVEGAHVADELYTVELVTGQLVDPPPKRRPATTGRVEHALDPRRSVLHELAPTEYVPLLTGREIGRDGKAECPFHEDWNPSLHVYDQPRDGWFCFQCERGGDIFNLAAELFGLDSQRDFREVKRRLLDALLGRAA